MKKSGQIILFDGVCNFCNGSVNFLIKRDPNGIFKFAPLQSEIGQQLITKNNITGEIDSIILVKENIVYIKSDALIEIIKELKWYWRMFSVVKILPRKFRDLLYDLIANNRYKWFGKMDSCMIPDENVKSRFIS
ncbi:MAG: thiol-disulfide oxidoreductase DCC family protein [Melioribacteraceae bacterium]|nr:MAG: thiol-disulfide oxidoreductase DCC family protein [Melioribacteraceae bacterium]